MQSKEIALVSKLSALGYPGAALALQQSIPKAGELPHMPQLTALLAMGVQRDAVLPDEYAPFSHRKPMP